MTGHVLGQRRSVRGARPETALAHVRPACFRACDGVAAVRFSGGDGRRIVTVSRRPALSGGRHVHALQETG